MSVFDRRHFLPPDQNLLNQFYQFSAQFEDVLKNLPYLLVRVNTISLSDNTDTFVFSTSAHPFDTVEYTSIVDIVDLTIRDGGLF